MPDNEIDPAGNTQQFRAFVQRGPRDPAATKSGVNTGLIIGVAVVVVIVAVVVGLAVKMM